MSKVALEKLLPQESKLKVDGVEYDLRKINVLDEIWLKDKYGDKVNTLFAERQIEPIAQIAFRLLKDKKKFQAVEEEGFDDIGRPCKVTVSGAHRLLRCLSGEQDKEDLMWAVFHAFGISRPDASGENTDSPNG